MLPSKNKLLPFSMKKIKIVLWYNLRQKTFKERFFQKSKAKQNIYELSYHLISVKLLKNSMFCITHSHVQKTEMKIILMKVCLNEGTKYHKSEPHMGLTRSKFRCIPSFKSPWKNIWSETLEKQIYVGVHNCSLFNIWNSKMLLFFEIRCPFHSFL